MSAADLADGLHVTGCPAGQRSEALKATNYGMGIAPPSASTKRKYCPVMYC